MEYSRRHASVFEEVMRGRGKDWDGEARLVTELVRTRRPEARSLLDVACGTGVHLATFNELFEEVEGLELSGPMRERARRRLPGIRLHAGDLRRFDVGRTFDAITCLCFSVAYSTTVEELESAIGCMGRHLVPGGVIVLEPWWFPEQFLDGYVDGHVVRDGDRVISRLTHSTEKDGCTVMTVHYAVAEPSGMTDFTEVEVAGLFTRDEYETAFERAGCAVEYLSNAPNGRGLFVATRAA